MAIKQTRGYSYQFVTDINDTQFNNKQIYKTHDYPDIVNFPESIRVIFMFGNVVDTVLSLSKRMNRFYDTLSKVYHSENMIHTASMFHDDILNLENLFDTWYKSHSFPLITIRYETLYSERTQKMLTDFLGFRVKFPPYRKRKTDQLSFSYRDTVIKTYASLSQKIELAEDCKIWE